MKIQKIKRNKFGGHFFSILKYLDLSGVMEEIAGYPRHRR